MDKGWIGDKSQLEYVLRFFGAEKDEDGKIKWWGKPPVSFMGMGEELVIDESAHVQIMGKKTSVVGLLNSTSYGYKVNVIM